MSPAAGRGRASLVERLAGHQVIVCCGSGGVGKTTTSAALGMALVAERDLRVMVLTVDPARRLASALGLREVGTEPRIISASRLRAAGLKPRGQLVAAMLDMKSTWDRMIERYAPNPETAARILGNRFYAGLSDAFIGSHEYMAMEELYELHQGGEYDCIIIDTPPSRNALDFIEAPDRLVDFVGGRLLSWLGRPSRFGWRAMNLAATPFLRMADRLLGAEMLEELAAFVGDVQAMYGGVQERARSVYRLLRSRHTGFVVVTTLEAAAVGEAEFFVSRLNEFGLPLRGVVVNRILPASLRDPGATAIAERLVGGATGLPALGPRPVARLAGETFLGLHDRAERDARQVDRLGRLGGATIARVPLIERDVSDLGSLAIVAARLRGG